MQQLWWTDASERRLRGMKHEIDSSIQQAVAECMSDATTEIEGKKDNVLSALSAILYDLDGRVRDEVHSFTRGLSAQRVQMDDAKATLSALSQQVESTRQQQDQKISDMHDNIVSLNSRVAALNLQHSPSVATEHVGSKVRSMSAGRGLHCTAADVAEHFQGAVADLQLQCSLINQEVRTLSMSQRASQIISNAVKGRIEQCSTLEEQLVDEISEFRSACVSLAAVVNSKMDEQDSQMTQFRNLADVVTRERAERVEQLSAVQLRVLSLQRSEQQARADELATHTQQSARDLEHEREARQAELATLRLELSRQFSAVVSDICAAKTTEAYRAPGRSTPSTQSDPSPPSTGSSEASADIEPAGRRAAPQARAPASRRCRSGERLCGRSLSRA